MRVEYPGAFIRKGPCVAIIVDDAYQSEKSVVVPNFMQSPKFSIEFCTGTIGREGRHVSMQGGDKKTMNCVHRAFFSSPLTRKFTREVELKIARGDEVRKFVSSIQPPLLC